MKWLVVLLLLSGCTTWHRVEPWPELRVIEHRVDHATMHEVCNKWVKWYEFPIACAVWDDRECHIWLTHDAPAWVRKHELKHCEGWMH
jgi:hypothetical protein